MGVLLNENENEAASKFMAEHYARPCKKRWSWWRSKENAAVQLFAESNGIGLSITVKCPYCGESEGISDIDSW